VRTFRAFLASCLVLMQVSCADILPWPGFESHPAIFSYTEQLPAAEVAEQVRCELVEFLQEEKTAQHDDPQEGSDLLDPSKGAQVQLKLTTDLQGSVTYLGIDLKKLGLGSLASLVTKSNSAPSLQLKAQGKATQTSQVDFTIPQTLQSKLQTQKKDATGKPIFDGNGAPVMKTVVMPENLRLTACSHSDPKRFLEYNWFRLWLSDALQRYKKRLNELGYNAPGLTFADRVCQPKLTISTQFQLLFDASAGTNIYQASPIILPISGLNVDASPDYTHYVQIIFALLPAGDQGKNRAEACDALQTTNPPASAHQ
jgi:hypothetical protein